MKTRDIVNRDIVNLTNCEHEPIHIPGSIQPHGFLLGISKNDLEIVFCSENTRQFIDKAYDHLLGKNIGWALGGEQAGRLLNYIKSDSRLYSAPLDLDINGQSFNCTIQLLDEYFLIEIEPGIGDNIEIADIYYQTKQFTSYIQNATTLRSLCQAVAEETRSITGYDRVMIYKFDEQYNGEIFAEARKEDIEPFLGLHYPHTDIPVQARELYIKNLLRLIVDVNYSPVPIYTIDDGSNRNLDLSLSILRSVSPIHIQYLQNMGVGATLTISLIYEGKLWGLIACHHYSPKYISMHTRIAAQLQGHFLTSQISVRQDAEEYALSKKLNVSLDHLLVQVFSSQSISLENLVKQRELLSLANAASVIIIVDEKIYCQGKVPPEEEIRNLALWFHSHASPSGFVSNKLIDSYADATKCETIAGVIYHSLGTGPFNCIFWCRPEAMQEVNWAGDPQKAIIKDEKGLSPRKSFELWKEVKKCESLPWQKPEQVAAANFANALQKHVHMLFLGREEEKQRKLSDKLREANAELENINWIGSHDLKEPLRKIQMFASRILDDEENSDLPFIDSVRKMNESAQRMQSLIRDILSYSKLSHIEDGFVPVDLNRILEKLLDEMQSEITEVNAIVKYQDLPVINGIPVLIQQLFLNLVRNALKFAKPGESPVVNISAGESAYPTGSSGQKNYYLVSITDQGIGFDTKQKDNIFKVFTRLHSKDEYHGTGIGLALCRKIMLNHRGYITVESKNGGGASFHLYFPRNEELQPNG